MKKMFIFLTAAVNCLLLVAQEDRLYRLLQVSGTEASAASLLAEAGISSPDDTAYVFLVNPMVCPRCEGIISPLAAYLGKADSNSSVAVLAFFPRRMAAKAYLDARNFRADTAIVITSDSMLRGFHYSSRRLDVPYVTKFCLSTGELLYAESLLGMNLDDETVRRIVRAADPGKKSDTTNYLAHIREPEQQDHFLQPYYSIRLRETDSITVSSLEILAVSPAGRYLLMKDFFTGAVIFDRETGAPVSAILPGEQEYRFFIDTGISNATFNYLKVNNVLNVMYFNSTVDDKGAVSIMASLPRLSIMSKGNVAYNNQMAIVKKDIHNRLTGITAVDRIPGERWTLIHSSACFDPVTQQIYMPVTRGWPAVGTSALDTSDTAGNPFLASFYDSCFLMAVYDFSGEFRTLAGKPDHEIAAHRLGYYATNPVMMISGGKLWVTSGPTGKIYRYPYPGGAEPDDSIQLFRVPWDRVNAKGLQGTLDYFYAYDEVLSERIIQFEVAGGRMAALVSESGSHYAVWYNLKRKKPESKLYIPSVMDGRKLVSYKMGKLDGKPVVFTVYESQSESSFTVYRLD